MHSHRYIHPCIPKPCTQERTRSTLSVCDVAVSFLVGVQVRNKDDVLTCARHMHTDSLAPVFLTSSVTGEGLELVRLFYNLLPQRHKW